MLKHSFNRVSVIGLGYIGLPTAAILASRGVKVVGVDINQTAVDTINKGKVHIVEPGLDVVVQSVVSTGHLRAVTSPEPAEAFIMAVPTPFKEDYAPDLRYVEAATRSISKVLKKGDLVILESTSPVGTTEMMLQWIGETRPDLKLPNPLTGEPGDLAIAYCPERVLPGHVMRELIENDRVVGGVSPMCTARAKELYKIFVSGDCVASNAKTAEMVKLTENAFRDVNIAFANELSMICEKIGINVWELISLANRHPRVKILQPGPGVGGHCISIDPWFIVHKNPEEARLIRTARQVNDSKPHFVVDKVLKTVKSSGKKRIACLGLAFKADIDDLRESPSVEIVKHLSTNSALTLFAVEPYVERLPEELSNKLNVRLVDSRTAILEAEIVLVLTNHRQFIELDRSLLQEKVVIDTRGIWQ
ncbi:MAG: UDP-N-acetyl-D-mannosamine dehydrogenase [Deltaproteobacteria bacterium]|nr:UDP-N-acetyl-D-mannosamine dehydrogenase [Deltaproteobacteria bacterium]